MNVSPVGMPLLPPGGGLRVSEPWNASVYKARQFYVYEVDMGLGATFAPGPNSPNVDATFQISNDSDFFWTELTLFALDNNFDAPTQNTDLLPALIMQVTDVATGRRYDNTLDELGGFTGNFPPAFDPAGTQAPPTADLTGNAQIPFLLLEPVLWERNSVIKLSVNDEALAGGANGVYSVVHFSFIGIKAFY
jgi:hypothetical protein